MSNPVESIGRFGSCTKDIDTYPYRFQLEQDVSFLRTKKQKTTNCVSVPLFFMHLLWGSVQSVGSRVGIERLLLTFNKTCDLGDRCITL